MASSSPHKKVSCLDSLKLSEREHQELLHHLRDEESHSRTKNRRNDQRIDYNIAGGIIIQVHHPGGSVANYMIRTRNLSKHGMGFLHGNFLHSGTPCLISLRRIDHGITSVTGEVRRCRLISGRIHEVGIRFQSPIEIEQYINTHETKDTDAGKTSIKMPELMGRVLYAEDSINDQELLKFQLKTLGMEVITVSNGPEALMHAEVEKFDLIITNIWLPGMTGPELAMCLRDKGYKGIILALTADAREDTRRQALEWGCSDLMLKPYAMEDLVRYVHKHVQEHRHRNDAKAPLTSVYWSNQSMKPLITGFLERLGTQVDELDELMSKDANIQILQKRCLDLKGTAGGYGFPQISAAADQLFQKLTSQAPVADRQAAYRELNGLCRRAVAVLSSSNHP